MQAKGTRKPSSSAKTIMAMAAETGRRRMGRSLKQLNGAGPWLDTLGQLGSGLAGVDVSSREEDTV